MPDKPTKQQVIAWAEQRKTHVFGEMHTFMDEDEDMHFWSSDDYNALLAKRWFKGLPPGFVPELLPLAFLGVQVGVTHTIAGDRPDCDVTFPDGSFRKEQDGTVGKAEKERRDLYRDWLSALWYMVATYTSENPVVDVVQKMIALGLGALSFSIAWNRWRDPPFGWEDDGRTPVPGKDATEKLKVEQWQSARNETLPWDFVSIPPQTLLFDPDHDPCHDFIIEDEVSSAAMKAEYPHLNLADDSSVKVKRLTYCSPGFYGIWVEGQNCLTSDKGADDNGIAENTTGRNWIRMAWGGWGAKDRKGSWARRGQGVIRGGRGIVKMLNGAIADAEAIRQVTAFPNPMVRGGTAADRQKTREAFRYGGAQVIEVFGEVILDVFKPPQVPEVVFQQLETAWKVYAMHFGAEVLRGEYKSEPDAKFVNRQAAAGLPFQATKVNANQLCSAVSSDILYSLKNHLLHPVTLMGVTMRPEDVVDGATITINLKPMTDDEKQSEREQAQKDMADGTMSKEEYVREQRGKENPEEILDEVAVRDYMTALLATPAAMDIGIQALQKRAQEQGLIPPPAPAAPPAPADQGAGVDNGIVQSPDMQPLQPAMPSQNGNGQATMTPAPVG